MQGCTPQSARRTPRGTRPDAAADADGADDADAAADADGADDAGDAGDDALHDHSQQRPSGGRGGIVVVGARGARGGPPMPVPNRRARKILSRRRKDRRETRSQHAPTQRWR